MLDVDLGDLIDYLAQSRRHAVDHPLRREHHQPAQVHVGGARVHARQADRGLQGGAVPGLRAGHRVAHRGHGGRGRRLRRRLRACRDRSGGPDRGRLRHRRAAGARAAPRRAAARDRHQRGRSGRSWRPTPCSRAAGVLAELSARHAQALAAGPAAVGVGRATRWTCSATRRPSGSGRPSQPLLADPGRTRCSSSSPHRR